MQIISNEKEFKLNSDTVVIIGKFDGVHLGHRLLLNEALLKRSECNLKIAAFTFDPSPSVYFGLEEDVAITTKSEKRQILEECGVDYLIEFPMNDETALIDAKEFVRKYLSDMMQARFIVCGDDLSFGYKGQGNYELLKSMEQEYGFETKEVSKVTFENDVISSSRIKNAIINGNLTDANKMLGRNYSFNGEIVHGNHIGTNIGFPTINIIPDEKKIIPKFGVYYSQTTIDEKKYNSITNVGCKPTVNNKKIIGIETYIYDFSNDVYGKNATVELLEFKRPERQFSNLEELTNMLKLDISEGNSYFS